MLQGEVGMAKFRVSTRDLKCISDRGFQVCMRGLPISSHTNLLEGFGTYRRPKDFFARLSLLGRGKAELSDLYGTLFLISAQKDYSPSANTSGQKKK